MKPTQRKGVPTNKTIQTQVTQVIRRGRFTESAKLTEIKVRKLGRNYHHLNEAMSQLWFGRTPYLLLGRATDGNVHSISCRNVEAKFAEWEKFNEERLKKLVTLLAELKQTMRETGGKPALLGLRGKEGASAVV